MRRAVRDAMARAKLRPQLLSGLAVSVVLAAALASGEASEAYHVRVVGGGGEAVASSGSWGLLGALPVAPAVNMPASEGDSGTTGPGCSFGCTNNIAWEDSLLSSMQGSLERRLDVIEIICAPQYTWSCDKALRVAVCESGPNLDGYSGYYVPPFQIDPILHDWRADLWTFAGNVEAAHQIFTERGGFSAWPVCQYR